MKTRWIPRPNDILALILASIWVVQQWRFLFLFFFCFWCGVLIVWQDETAYSAADVEAYAAGFGRVLEGDTSTSQQLCDRNAGNGWVNYQSRLCFFNCLIYWCNFWYCCGYSRSLFSFRDFNWSFPKNALIYEVMDRRNSSWGLGLYSFLRS